MLHQLVVPNGNGMSTDTVQNGWIVDYGTSAYDSTRGAAVSTAIKGFYNDQHGQWSGELAWTSAVIDVYDINAHLDGSPHGSPIDSFASGIGPVLHTGTFLPAGVALVLGFRSSYGTDFEAGPTASIPTDVRARAEGAPATHSGKTRPRSSHRGRLYLPPMNISVVDGPVDPADTARPKASVVAGMLASFKACSDAIIAAGCTLVQWSRKLARVLPIFEAGMEVAFAYMRLREVRALTRPTVAL